VPGGSHPRGPREGAPGGGVAQRCGHGYTHASPPHRNDRRCPHTGFAQTTTGLRAQRQHPSCPRRHHPLPLPSRPRPRSRTGLRGGFPKRRTLLSTPSRDNTPPTPAEAARRREVSREAPCTQRAADARALRPAEAARSARNALPHGLRRRDGTDLRRRDANGTSPILLRGCPGLQLGRNRTPAEQGRERGFAPGAKDRPHDPVIRPACGARTKLRTSVDREPRQRIQSLALPNRAGSNPAGVEGVRSCRSLTRRAS
jgi:hypothetical protein